MTRKAEARLSHARRVFALKVAALAALPALAVVLIVALPPPMADHGDLPDYALRDARVMEAYHFAKSDQGWILDSMACYCGCGQHTGHSSNLACFVKGDGSGYDEHGANCQVCVDIALSAKSMHAAGTPLKEIRTTIDARYPGYPATPTPMPP